MQRMRPLWVYLTFATLLGLWAPLARASGGHCNFSDRIHDIDRGVGGGGPWPWRPSRTIQQENVLASIKLGSLSKDKSLVTIYTRDGKSVTGYVSVTGDGPDAMVMVGTSNDISHAQQWTRLKMSSIDPDMIHVGEPMPGLGGIKKGDVCTFESSATGNTYEGTFAGVTTKGDIQIIPKNSADGLPEILDRKNIKSVNGKPLTGEAHAPRGNPAPGWNASGGAPKPSGGIPREAAPAYGRLEDLGTQQVTVYTKDGKAYSGYVGRNPDGSVAILPDGRVQISMFPGQRGLNQNVAAYWVDLKDVTAQMIHTGPPIPGLEGWPHGRLSSIVSKGGYTHEGVITGVEEGAVWITPTDGRPAYKISLDEVSLINGKPLRTPPPAPGGPHANPPPRDPPPRGQGFSEPPPAQGRPARGPASPVEQQYSEYKFRDAARMEGNQAEVTFYTRDGDEIHGLVTLDYDGNLLKSNGKLVLQQSKDFRNLGNRIQTRLIDLADVDAEAIHTGRPIPGVADAIKSGKTVTLESFNNTYTGKIIGVTPEGNLQFVEVGGTKTTLKLEKLKEVNGQSVEEYNAARAKARNPGAGARPGPAAGAEPPPSPGRKARMPADEKEQGYSKYKFEGIASRGNGRAEVTFYTMDGQEMHGTVKVTPDGELFGIYSQNGSGRKLIRLWLNDATSTTFDLAEVDSTTIHVGKPIPGVGDAITSGKTVTLESFNNTYTGRVTGVTPAGDLNFFITGETEMTVMKLEKLKTVNGKSVEAYNAARGKAPGAGAGQGGARAGAAAQPPPPPKAAPLGPVDPQYAHIDDFDVWSQSAAGQLAKDKTKWLNYREQKAALRKAWAQDVLGVTDATPVDEINKKFRKLMVQIQKDGATNPETARRAKYVSEAHTEIKDNKAQPLMDGAPEKGGI